MPSSQAPAPKPDPPESPPQRKRGRWLKRLGVLLVFLVVLAFAINGPVARWIVGKVLTDQLAKLGLEGEVEVSGQLHRGFTLTDAEFRGQEQIQLLKFDKLEVSYKLGDLRDKKIEKLVGEGVDFVMRTEEKPEDPDKPIPFEKIGNSLREIRPLVVHPDIRLRDIKVTIIPPSGEPQVSTLDALRHEGGTSTFEVEGLASTMIDRPPPERPNTGTEGEPAQESESAAPDETIKPDPSNAAATQARVDQAQTTKRSFTIDWQEDSISVDKLDTLPGIAAEDLEVRYKEGEALGVSGSITAGGARLAIDADQTGAGTVTLQEGPLDLSQLEIPGDLDLSGRVEELNANLSGLLDGPSAWRGDFRVVAQEAGWAGRSLPPLTLAGSLQDDRIQVQTQVGTVLDLEATIANSPLRELEEGGEEWWKGLPVAFNVSTPSLHEALRTTFELLEMEQPDYANIPEGAIALDGNLSLGGDLGVAPADLAWQFSDIVFQEKGIPNLEGSATLADGVAGISASLAQPRPNETVDLTASWTLESKSYEATLDVDLPDPAWIDAFIPGTSPYWRPTGRVAVNWSGSGALPDDAPQQHAGALEVSELTLNAPDERTTEIALEGTYDWPGMVELSALQIDNGELSLDGALRWADERLTVTGLKLEDQTGPLAQFEGSAPLGMDTLTPDKFFAQEEPLNLDLETREFSLERLATFLPLPLPPGFAANVQADLQVTGTPTRPLVGGFLKARGVETPGPEELPPFDAEINFSTANRVLTAQGSVTEPGGPVASLEASLPFEIDTLLKDPEAFKTLPLKAQVVIDGFELQRLQLFAPALAEVDGTLSARVSAAGTINDPKLSGQAEVGIDRYPLPEGLPYEDLEDIRLRVRLEGERILIERSSLTSAGGSLSLSGSIGLADGKPEFDVTVTADSMLLWRDDTVLSRLNGSLTASGSLQQATVRGNLGVVESLIYKDIELVPLGVPTGNVPKPQLPSFDQAGGGDPFDVVPEPFANWNVDVAIATTDPILIRGNIATGRITAATRITGTLGNPRPSGVINLDNAEAALPLSKLTVRQGTITLRPDQPLDPVIDVRGTTVVNNYRISLYLFGPVSNPEYDLFSDPPLPESEILTLIATGTTTAGLQDQDTATMKALQFAINELKRRFAKPGSDSLFQKFLETLEIVDIRVGDDDPFQGRKYTSATLQLNQFLFFSAAVDREGQTRGVVMYAPQPDDPEARGIFQEPGGPGKRARPNKFQIVGLRAIDPDTALGALAGRLEYIQDRPTTPSRANDAAFLLERFLQQQGFTDPVVSGLIPSPGRIVLAVQEGERSSLGEIVVSGVEGELAEGVRAQIQSAHEGRARLPGEGIPYLRENNSAGVKNATAFLHSEGYWGGRAKLQRVVRDPQTGRAQLFVAVERGPLYNLALPNVAPGTPNRVEIIEKLRTLEGRVAKTKNINIARNTVSRTFRNRGYSTAEVFMKANHEGGVTQLTFRVTLGRVYNVGEIELQNLSQVDESIVEGRFDQFEGKTYNREEIDDEIRTLFGTGAFSGIRLEERPQPDGSIDVTLHFREGKPDGYQVYAGVGSFEGFILGAGYYHRNLFGNLWNLTTRAEISGIGLLGEVGVTDPFFLGYDLRFTPRAFLQSRTYEGYRKFESGAGVELAWDVTDHYSMAVDWTTSFVTLSADGLPNSEVGPNNYFLNVLGLTQTYDKRNNIAVPTDGYYATLTTDLGLSLGEANVSFFRAEAHGSVYEPLNDKAFVALGGRAGMIVPSVESEELPVDLRHFLGGANSVRSFPARELGPRAANGVPRGGQSYWAANAEFIHSIVGPVKGVVFLDAGSLSRDHFEIFSGDIKYALGLGVRIDLPIGPVRLEYGHALNPEGNDPSGTLHFAIGAAF